jgi:hypothetical protein
MGKLASRVALGLGGSLPCRGFFCLSPGRVNAAFAPHGALAAPPSGTLPMQLQHKSAARSDAMAAPKIDRAFAPG